MPSRHAEKIVRAQPHVCRLALRLDFGLQRVVSPADTTFLAQFASRSFVLGWCRGLGHALCMARSLDARRSASDGRETDLNYVLLLYCNAADAHTYIQVHRMSTRCYLSIYLPVYLYLPFYPCISLSRSLSVSLPAFVAYAAIDF